MGEIAINRLRKLGILFLILVLGPVSTASASSAVNLNGAERYAMNLFPSNFTEVGNDARFAGPDRDLADFAHDHLWFNDYDGGYYYHEETGDTSNMGFALTLDACESEPDIYYVAFLSVASGLAWNNGDLKLSLADAEAKFGIP